MNPSIFTKLSLKKRLLIIILTSSLLPLGLIGTLSYYKMYAMLNNKIESSVQNNLQQVALSLENTLSNLNHVTQQLAFNGSIGRDLQHYLDTSNVYEKSRLEKELINELNIINFANPSIGLTFYYFQNDHRFLFENFPIKKDFDLDKLPILQQYESLTYFGPHKASNRFDDSNVISVYRQANIPERDDVYVYVETGFEFTQKILQSNQKGMHVDHLIVNDKGVVSYSENASGFPIGTVYPAGNEPGQLVKHEGYYLFQNVSNQGWSVVSVIAQSEYNKEISEWIKQFAGFSLLSIAVSLLLGWLLWRMVYVPLTRFNKEIMQLANKNFHSEIKMMQIPEFDHLLHQFWHMRKQIWDLLAEVEQKEKRRADLEVEKLMYQINPHFLYNTLDTVCWLARLNGQDKIDRLVTSLNKLLHYNLDKQGQETTIKQEIGALKEYLNLQQIRYDFRFGVKIEADEFVENQSIPRFILQPLVENALYHGLGDDGVIQVQVSVEDASYVVVSVSDNGIGLSEEAIHKLLHNERGENKKMGFGIGINYVKRILLSRYGPGAELQIKSSEGGGTTVLLRLPLKKEGESVERINRG
ncbi:sensor histidine kinase [Paenibacillus mendelii]|uniref:histidine kinase n=1 Tax=Paenibacillus mendelii TaxID=206163 RepID=A0ABV6JBW5_9BACL|nr:histidine kinase [Paenibacillus mendelii]MCQ6562649.1 histidine kinase [Paenibacillus mendelii]